MLASEYLFPLDKPAVRLEEVAKQTHLDRRELNRLKRDWLLRVRKALLEDDYESCRFRFAPEFTAHLKALRADLAGARHGAISAEIWDGILKMRCGTTRNRLGDSEVTLLELLGFQLIRFRGRGFQPAILPAGQSALPLRQAVLKAHKLLKRKFPSGATAPTLIRALRQKGVNVAARDMAAILGALPIVHRSDSSKVYEYSPEDLTTLGDQLARALGMQEQPTHVSELARLIAPFLKEDRKVSYETIIGTLSDDKRFKPVGRNGFWLLVDWERRKKRTITDAAASILEKYGQPMTQFELFSRISMVRPVAFSSVGVKLRNDPRFVRQGEGTWALSGGNERSS
ncbi:MAG TPA: hypothetical protein VGF73_11430 [Chthoniobacterales bacterium]